MPERKLRRGRTAPFFLVSSFKVRHYQVLMSFFLRLFGLMVLLPSLAHAATLEIPGDGTSVSGIGVISGWKCEAGDITISLNGEAPFPAMYGLPRSDTSAVCGDDDGNNGFFSYWNWGNLGDGDHTVVAYDNGEEFAESTFTVTTPGTDFLRGASKRVTVEDFPNPGDTTVLEWNQGTQHFEIVEFIEMGPTDLGECMEGLTLHPGEMCSGSLLGSIDYTVSVNEAGEVCIDTGDLVPVDGCYPDVASLPGLLSQANIEATRHADGSWTIDSLPSGS